MIWNFRFLYITFLIASSSTISKESEEILSIGNLFGDSNSYNDKKVVFKGYYAEGIFLKMIDFHGISMNII